MAANFRNRISMQPMRSCTMEWKDLSFLWLGGHELLFGRRRRRKKKRGVEWGMKTSHLQVFISSLIRLQEARCVKAPLTTSTSIFTYTHTTLKWLEWICWVLFVNSKFTDYAKISIVLNNVKLLWIIHTHTFIFIFIFYLKN